jgi:dolichol-phosphate mannosyltransferase
VRTLVLAPTYQEAENIEDFVRQVRAALPDADLLVVDDSSPDGTAAMAEELGLRLGGVQVLRRPRKTGLGGAYRDGFALALEQGYDRVVQMDADLSHDPAVLVDMVRAVDEGADLVIGSRYMPGGSIPNWPWHRRALSKWGNRYAGFVLGTEVTDGTSGYRAFRGDVLRAAVPATTRASGYGIQFELAYRVWKRGGKIVEIPISFTDRYRGTSKMTWTIAAEELVLVTWWGIRDRLLRPFVRRLRRS